MPPSRDSPDGGSRYPEQGQSRPAPSRGASLQRFFSTFPGRWPGVGLLLLRILVGGAAVAQGTSYLAYVEHPTIGSWCAGVSGIAGGASLLMGFLTPGAAAAAGASIAFITIFRFPPPDPGYFQDRIGGLCVVVVAAALVLLGPGALSLDARLFGRREIIFPDSSQQPRS